MEAFKRISVTVLIISLVLFTLLAILSIWGVLDGDIAWKSLATLGVIAFSSLIAVAIAKIMEHKPEHPTPPKVQ